jgi:CRISPR system Cascade subunit CasD
MLAAALGIERSEERRLADLTDSIGFAVRVEDPGLLASDYHTTQVPPARRNRRFATRREELEVARDDLKTILSQREFRNGCYATICVWLKPGATVLLAEMRTALAKPNFAPFAGRKAHPLMLPSLPKIVPATHLRAAFAAYDASEPAAVRQLKVDYRIVPRPDTSATIYADIDGILPTDAQRLEQRRDLPESRNKWRFGLRTEAVLRSSNNGASK